MAHDHVGGGKCPYCLEHGLYDEAPWLRKDSLHHAIQGEEKQGSLFDPELFNDRRQ